MSGRRRMRGGNLAGAKIAALAVLMLAGGVRRDFAADAPDRARELIRQAGNADDDGQRLELLRQLEQLPDLDESLRQEAAKMAAAVRQWVESPNLSYFSREVTRSLDFDFGVSEQSPLYPLTCIYRGRMLVWLTLESGNIIRYVDRRRQFLDKAAENFRVAREAFPGNRIVRMYLGEPLPWPKTLAGAEQAPPWAAWQRENLERLADIIEWWIDHRMQPSGEFGGGWGDDCEMWRWWIPVLIAFEDPRITAAQARFSEALLNQPHMQGGYTSRMTDVEHTAEDSADAITPMMHLDPDNPVWKSRALRLADLMENLWTGRNQRGMLQFKSTYFTVDRVDDQDDRACDTVYHPRAIQPALLYWQRTGDPKLSALFSDWMDTWVDAAARSERGKPAGVIPSAIHWPDGGVGGVGPNWWDPRNHSEPTLYEWPSASSMMVGSLLLTWHMTNNDKYLQPLRSMAQIRLKWRRRQPPRQEPSSGSEPWCAAELGFLAPTLAKYKLLTGSQEFDELLQRDYGPLPGEGADGDRGRLVSGLEESAAALRINWPGYTSEVRWTDRVLRFPALFRAGYMFAEDLPAIKTPNPALIYSAATGDPGDAGYFPLAAVRWRTPPRDIAALVNQTGKRQFSADLFHFGDQPRSMSAELYLLQPGAYRWRLRNQRTGAVVAEKSLEVLGPRTNIPLTLPPRTLCQLDVF